MNKNQIMGGLMRVLIGDALGLPVQFAPREERKKKPVAVTEAPGESSKKEGEAAEKPARAK